MEVVMHVANINEAKANLSHLIKRALAGDEIIIARSNEPLVRLEPYHQDTRPRVGGQWAGLVEIGDDFEFTDAEIDELFYAPILQTEAQ
jgi:prevent-host-death family protein